MTITEIADKVAAAVVSMRDNGLSIDGMCVAIHPATCAGVPVDELARVVSIPLFISAWFPTDRFTIMPIQDL